MYVRGLWQLCLIQRSQFPKMSLSWVIGVMRDKELGTDIESTVNERIYKFIFKIKYVNGNYWFIILIEKCNK